MSVLSDKLTLFAMCVCALQVDYIPVTTGNIELPAATKTVRSSASTTGFSLIASVALLLVSFAFLL